MNIQLSKKYDTNINIKQWYASPKLDGVRCLFYDNALWTRSGKKIISCDHILNQAQRLGYSFLDGELYHHDMSFESIQGHAISKKNSTKLQYHVFVRKQITHQVFESTKNLSNDIITVKSELIDKNQINSYLKKAIENGYEGIMLRNPDVLYASGRTNHLLKLKPEKKIMDCKIIDTVNGIKGGKNVLTKLLVRQKNGIEIYIGTGFNDKFRNENLDNTKIIGKICEIEYQNLTNKGKMRFASFKRLRLDL